MIILNLFNKKWDWAAWIKLVSLTIQTVGWLL